MSLFPLKNERALHDKGIQWSLVRREMLAPLSPPKENHSLSDVFIILLRCRIRQSNSDSLTRLSPITDSLGNPKITNEYYSRESITPPMKPYEVLATTLRELEADVLSLYGS